MLTDPVGRAANPTPLHRLDGLAAQFPGGPELFVKREDLCGVALGGNKLRKLRLLLADAAAQKATVVVTTGAPQSNHCAMTAVTAAMAGLRTELLFAGSDPGVRTGNLQIGLLVGATMTFLGDGDGATVADRLAQRVCELRKAGETPYPIPLGGSTALGVAACAGIVAELVDQLDGRPITHIVVAAGSLGTMAGLVLGAWAAGLDCLIDGYTVLWPAVDAAQRLAELLHVARRDYFPQVAPRATYRLFGSQLGGGYGVPTGAGAEAMRLAACHDGLLLDPTYTAKAMAGLVAGIRSGAYTAGHRVLFVHTGGVAGLLATSAPSTEMSSPEGKETQ
jgi:1-aminocyclopropane-1-carboxylate deaminase/D-cysteine desulfhydrase-like pyridoxal-dependent ACC family enzyme